MTGDCAEDKHNSCIVHEYTSMCKCPCHGFTITKEEVEYLVNNIQHEYLNKDTYYFARDLFNRMEQFIKENGK